MKANQIQSDADLLERLHQAAQRQLTKQELHTQRVSFIFGNLPNDSNLTRHQVEEVLAQSEGTEAA